MVVFLPSETAHDLCSRVHKITSLKGNVPFDLYFLDQISSSRNLWFTLFWQFLQIFLLHPSLILKLDVDFQPSQSSSF